MRRCIGSLSMMAILVALSSGCGDSEEDPGATDTPVPVDFGGEVTGTLGGYAFGEITGAFFEKGYTSEGQYMMRLWLDDYSQSCEEFKELIAQGSSFQADDPEKPHGIIILELMIWDGEKFIGPATTGTYVVAPEEQPPAGTKVFFGDVFVTTIDGDSSDDLLYTTEGTTGSVLLEEVSEQVVSGTLDFTVGEWEAHGEGEKLPLSGRFDAIPCL